MIEYRPETGCPDPKSRAFSFDTHNTEIVRLVYL